MFHWSLALCFAGEWFTRDARYLYLHEFLGYAIGALVLFRVAWGFTGTRWARFASFPLSARAGLRYLSELAHRRAGAHAGHNPAGSWAIYALLVLAAAEVATGLLTLGAEKHLGPLARSFGYRAGDLAHTLHEGLAYAMLALVGVHIAGVVVGSVVERQNLAVGMVTGRKRATEQDAVGAHHPLAGIVAAVLIAAAFAAFANWSFEPRMKHARLRPLPQDASWQSECGSCHLAYHPSLLPARSWERMFATQHEHFGEDLALGDDTVGQLMNYARADSAERLQSPAAWKIQGSTPANDAPLRITETPYWKARHAALDAATWRKVHASDCGGCHRDAESGTFSVSEIDSQVKPAAPRRTNPS